MMILQPSSSWVTLTDRLCRPDEDASFEVDAEAEAEDLLVLLDEVATELRALTLPPP